MVKVIAASGRLALALEAEQQHSAVDSEHRGRNRSMGARHQTASHRVSQHRLVLLQVGLVLLGILVRGSSSGKANGMGAAPPDQRLGYAAILGSALGYSCLGVPLPADQTLHVKRCCDAPAMCARYGLHSNA